MFAVFVSVCLMCVCFGLFVACFVGMFGFTCVVICFGAICLIVVSGFGVVGLCFGCFLFAFRLWSVVYMMFLLLV